MAKQISASLKFYYDEELFNNRWASELDPTTLALLESGAMVESAEIANLISVGGNYYTIPFYKDIEGEELNYDGATDITSDDTESGKQSGVVYGRAKGWKNTIFVNDFTSADPMANILARIQKWRSKKMQKRITGILNAVLSTTNFAETEYGAEWAKHESNIASSTTNVTEENQIGLTSLRRLAVKALGDNADKFEVAIMHSEVANKLSEFNVLEFFKYNDARGQELDVKVGRSGNMVIFITDEVPTSLNETSNAVEYTTYALGRGVLLHASAPVEKPSDLVYDAKKNGGTEELITRYRETVHPNGFSFVMTDLPISPTDAQLANPENWKLEMNPKNIAIARLITN